MVIGRSRNDASGNTPATVVAMHMLERKPNNDFVADLAQRESGLIIGGAADQEELQGYVDAVMLYVSTCMAVESGLPPENVADQIMARAPTFSELSPRVRAKAREFVSSNTLWCAQQFRPQDAFDGHQFMNALVERVGASAGRPKYKQGIRTARDTLLMYVDLILAYLAGKIPGPSS